MQIVNNIEMYVYILEERCFFIRILFSICNISIHLLFVCCAQLKLMYYCAIIQI
jgi:hypothetical protein